MTMHVVPTRVWSIFAISDTELSSQPIQMYINTDLCYLYKLISLSKQWMLLLIVYIFMDCQDIIIVKKYNFSNIKCSSFHGGSVATAGEVYCSRAPIHALGFPKRSCCLEYNTCPWFVVIMD